MEWNGDGDGDAEPRPVEAGVLPRVMAFLDWLGAEGLRRAALADFRNAHFLASAIGQIAGFRPAFAAPFHNEFVIRTPLSPAEVVRELEEQGIFAGVPILIEEGRHEGLLMAVSGGRTPAQVEYFLKALKQLRDRNAGRILGIDT